MESGPRVLLLPAMSLFFFQRAVQIKTENGSKLYVAPPVEYSDDFEPYDSLDLESSGSEQSGRSQVCTFPSFRCLRGGDESRFLPPLKELIPLSS